MQLTTTIFPYRLCFHKPAQTSRGAYMYHNVWFVVVASPEYPHCFGIGECAPLPDLSCDFSDHYQQHLQQACHELSVTGHINYANWFAFPSILFGLESALHHFHQQITQLKISPFQLWETPFSQGQQCIDINGLIWMDNIDIMQAQIEQKIEAGFRCIKLKIGALDFNDELMLLKQIRHRFSKHQITLRVDANGAFSPKDVLYKLDQLAQYDIHSIEQPIAAKQWRVMAELIQSSPIPIALDEELIGIITSEQKQELLTYLKPHYLILKPSLHGGISGVKTWITLADQAQIKWWFTSALESNIGLNAIAQLAATYSLTLPQGLGTGLLYRNNIPLPLTIRQAALWFDPHQSLSSTQLLNIFTGNL